MTKEEEKQLEKEFNEKYANYIRKLEEKRFLRKKKLELRKIKKDYNVKLGLTTTKLLSYYLFIIFNVVLIYALVAMWHFADLSYLGVIITDILGQLLIYAIYSIRAFKDTQAEEQIKLERDKMDSIPSAIGSKIQELIDKIDNCGNMDNSEETDENCEDEQDNNDENE